MKRMQQDLALQHPVYFQSPHLIPIYSRLARELQTADSFSEIVVEALLTEILGLTMRQQFVPERRLPLWLKRIVEVLSSTSDRFMIRELASKAGVHPVHLARIFRRYYGCTVGEYVRSIRIQQSQQDLLDSDQPIAEIAIKNGFADQSHFTRSFKHVTGVTPARYRLQRF